jgi:hypothetical protein
MWLLRHHFGIYPLWQLLKDFFERRGREGFAKSAEEEKRKEQPRLMGN